MTARSTRHGLTGAVLAACIGLLPAELHPQPDFGDNTSQWANDGECDDPRFEGEGAAETLLEADRGHDATDCRKLFGAGRVALRDGTAGERVHHRGRLEKGDDTLSSGEFVDSYEFEGSPGQHVAIDVRSSAFDTYLILKDPAGEQTENDDAQDGGVGRSTIEADLTEAGMYRVLVTSYAPGESGAYSLTIDLSAASERSAPAARGFTTLIVGGPIRAR